MTGKTARTASLANFTACDGVPSVDRGRTMADRAREIVAGFIDGGDACAVCELADGREGDRMATALRAVSNGRVRVSQRGTRVYMEVA